MHLHKNIAFYICCYIVPSEDASAVRFTSLLAIAASSALD